MRILAGLLLSFVVFVVSAAPAGAAADQRVSGRLDTVRTDTGGNCYSLSGTLQRPGPDMQFSGTFCFVDIGSVCAAGIEGSGTFSGPEGSISASFTGVDVCSQFANLWHVTFTITGGIRAYGHASGQFFGEGCHPGTGPVLNISTDQSVPAPSPPCNVLPGT